MSPLCVITSSSVPAGVRGALNQWLIEVLPGVYVGRPTARIREYLWKELVSALESEEKPYAAMITQAETEQGYVARTVGHFRYELVDFDGLQLVTVEHFPRSLASGGSTATD